MHPRSLRRLIPASAVAGLLLLPGAVRALPLSAPDGPAAVRWQIGDLFSWLGQTFASLWAEEEGANAPASPEPLAGGSESDTGKLIDPNG